ncbi:MAG TPA: hypothetical protein VJS66_09590, partial [Burkholderiales bacterium]|nr:hypothetical protein [Burkholderiales bacterium]
MTTSISAPFPNDADILAALNRHCRCAVVDDAKLTREIETAMPPGLFPALHETHPHLFSATAVFVSREDIERMRALISAVERVVATALYRERMLAWADPIAIIDPG